MKVTGTGGGAMPGGRFRQIGPRLVSRAIKAPDTWPARAILARAGWRKGRAVDIAAVASDSVTLAPAGPSTVHAPQGLGAAGAPHAGIFPALQAHAIDGARDGVIDGAIVSAYSPAVVVGDAVVLPPPLRAQGHRIRTAEEGLFRDGPSGPVVARGADVTIPAAIHVGGAGAFNWYHFVLECLPKAWLAQRLPARFDDHVLLVPEECRRIPSFADALAAVSGGRALHALPRGTTAAVARLVVIDEISVAPFNMVPGAWPQITDYAQHDRELAAFVAALRGAILGADAPVDDGRRIFLARPGVRRDYNQADLIAIAQRHGFEPVSLEGLSLRDQARVFAGASAVIGPSGAAWVGMIFRDRPMAGLSWLPAAYDRFCSYATLAHLLGHRLRFIEAETAGRLASTGDAYKASYTVSPSRFEAAVRDLLEQVNP